MKKYSKLMSLVLRHAPETLGLTLDANGWVNVENLVNAIRNRYSEFSHDLLETVVAENDKKRFEFDVSGELIRACQGHSVSVDLQLSEKEPPAYLYHGTARKHLEAIYRSGLQKMNRHAVHLSADKQTATTVGRRQGGETVVLVIRAQYMHQYGHKFYQSTNGVWLTDTVPNEYIGLLTPDSKGYIIPS